MNAPWLKFYPADWRADPALRMCSLAARGLWMEMLCLMHEAQPRGSLLVNGRRPDDRQLAALVGVPASKVTPLLDELESAGVFSREEEGTIFSRRMRKDEERAARDRARGSEGGNPYVRRGTVPKEQRVRKYKRSDAPEKTQRIFDRTKGRCHWCKTELLFRGVGGEPNLFHVDHVIPVCDGGTNDESNLVAACADCNHARKLIGWEPPPDPNGGVGVGNPSDRKAQKPEARSQKPEGLAHAKPGGRAGDAPDLADLRQRLHEAFDGAGAMPVDTSYAGVWLARGYQPAIILAVVASHLARNRNIRNLKYFDGPIVEAHAVPSAPAAVPSAVVTPLRPGGAHVRETRSVHDAAAALERFVQAAEPDEDRPAGLLGFDRREAG